MCWSLLLIDLIIFIKIRLQHKCFPVKCAKYSQTAVLKNICERLFLPQLPLGNVFVGELKLTFSFFTLSSTSLFNPNQTGRGGGGGETVPPGTFCLITFLVTHPNFMKFGGFS